MNERWHERNEARRAEVEPPDRYQWVRRLITALIIFGGIALGFMFASDAMGSGLLFIVIIIALVMTHEAGHFFTALLSFFERCS